MFFHQLVKIFPVLWSMKVHYPIHKSPPLDPILNYYSPIHISTPSHPISPSYIWSCLLVKYQRNRLIKISYHTVLRCTQKSRVIIEKLIIAHLLKIFPAFYETRRFITYSQDPATGPYLEPFESSAHPHIMFKIIFNNIIPYMHRPHKRHLRLRFSN
jgi:hypothetical protein